MTLYELLKLMPQYAMIIIRSGENIIFWGEVNALSGHVLDRKVQLIEPMMIDEDRGELLGSVIITLK